MGYQSLKRIIAAGRHTGAWVVNEDDEAKIAELLVEIDATRTALKSLPGDILNLRCHCNYSSMEAKIAFEAGHRAARHEAAVLAGAIPVKE